MSDARPTLPQVIRFGTFSVDLRSGEVHREGIRVALQDQPLRVLARLLQRPGELVTREELRRELWPDDTYLDFEHGVNAAVKRLRDALGDSADAPRYIETLPRRGYRFIVPVDAGEAAPMAPRARPTRLVDSLRSRGALAALLALLIGGAALSAWLWYGRGSSGPRADSAPAAPPAVSTRRAVAVVVFENRTEDPTFHPLGLRISRRLIRTVAEVPDVEVLADALGQNGRADLTEVTVRDARARESGASLLVDGAMFLHGERLELQSQILEASSGRLLYALPPFTATRADPEPALEALERHVAGAVAIHFDEFFGGLDFVSHPPPIDAYREYRAGVEVSAGDNPRALAHFQRALEIAPRFALPRVLLFAYGSFSETAKARAELALLERDWNHLGPAERLLVDFLREDTEGRSTEALRVLQDVEALLPQSLLVNYYIILQSLMLNRPRAAVEAFDRVAVDGRTLRYRIGTWRVEHLTRALHLLGDYERELDESRRGQLAAPGMLPFVQAEVRALAALGRLAELEAAVDRSPAIPASVGVVGGVLEQTSLELRAHGYREAAIAMANRAVEWQRAQPAGTTYRGARYFTGRVLYHAERWEDAERVFVGLYTEKERLPNRAWEQPYVLPGWMGVCAARRGDLARARAFSEELLRLTDRDHYGESTYWRARIAAVLGERQRAVDLLREALAEGLWVALSLHLAPDFESLRDYPPFQELVRPKE